MCRLYSYSITTIRDYENDNTTTMKSDVHLNTGAIKSIRGSRGKKRQRESSIRAKTYSSSFEHTHTNGLYSRHKGLSTLHHYLILTPHKILSVLSRILEEEKKKVLYKHNKKTYIPIYSALLSSSRGGLASRGGLLDLDLRSGSGTGSGSRSTRRTRARTRTSTIVVSLLVITSSHDAHISFHRDSADFPFLFLKSVSLIFFIATSKSP